MTPHRHTKSGRGRSRVAIRGRRTAAGLRLIGALAAMLACRVVTHGFSPIAPLSYWPVSAVDGPVVFHANLLAAPPNRPNPPLQDGSTSWNAAFTAQVNAWNAVLPDNVLLLQVDTSAAPAPANGDGKNDVFFSDTVYGDTWGSSTVGICLSMWSGNERTEADILFNATKTWNSYTGNLQGSTNDFRRVAQHELGHALLLDHPDDVGQSVPAIMNSRSSNTDALTADDRAGVLSIFGGIVPPTITVQPRQMVTTSGGQFLINVSATGSEPLSYQWQRSTNGGGTWNDLAGFTFPNGSASGYANGTLFRVRVTNPAGTVTSRAVLLSASGAAVAPAFVFDPVDTTVAQGGDTVFAVQASGSRMPTYQWEYSSNGGGSWGPMFSSFGPTDVAGIDSATLRITQAIPQMNGYQFRCVATNPAGTATSAVATLAVVSGGPDPYFTWQPRDIHTTAGTLTLVPAGVAGSPTPALQWQLSQVGGSTWTDITNGAVFTGASTLTLSITSPDVSLDGALLRLNAINNFGSARSRTVALSVQAAAAAPTILADPDAAVVGSGASAVFSARVSSWPAPAMQWEYSTDGVAYTPLSDGLFERGTTTLDTIVTGSNSRTLSLIGVDPLLDAVRFRLVARNESGGATSAAALLTVGDGITAPSITAHPTNATVTYPGDPTFTVASSGTPTPTIQWQVSSDAGANWAAVANNAPFSGATSTTLSLTDPSATLSGSWFRAVATNSAGSAESSAAILTVNRAAATVTLGALEQGYDGTPKSISVSVTPVGLPVAVTYDGSSTVPSAIGVYSASATVTDPNYIGGAVAPFTIVPGLALTQTGTITRSAGGQATLGVTLNSPAGTTLRWQLRVPGGTDWIDVPGATGASYAIPSTQAFHQGSYRVIATYGGISATSPIVALVVDAPAPSNARVMNLSTRALDLTGDNLLIPGFVISGTGTKRMLVRAVGPGLFDTFGLQGYLVDPQLSLRNQETNTQIGANDDWGSSADKAAIITTSQSVGAFPLLEGSKDSVLLVDLPAGRYTAPAVGAADGTGIAMVELYDADPGNTGGARLVNISNRGFVDVGDKIMIPGFVVSNEGSRTFLIRAVGPGLRSTFGLQGVLEDPMLTVFNGNGQAILTNDNWDGIPGSSTTSTVAGQVGAFPLLALSTDAAFVVTLPPGGYTIQATGRNSTTGVALVEVYLVP